MLPKDGQQFKNQIPEGTMVFGAVTNAFTTLNNLGTDSIHNHIHVDSTFDEPVSLKFSTGDTIIAKAGGNFVYDDFPHDGIIYIKYNGVANPTSGQIVVRSW